MELGAYLYQVLDNVLVNLMTLSLIGRLEIGYISFEIKVRDLVNELYWNLSGLDWTLVEYIYIYIYVVSR